MSSDLETNDVEAAGRRPLALVDMLVPLLIFIFCGVVTYIALHLDSAPPIVIGEAMQPRSFPIFLMALIATLNAILIWQMMNGRQMPRVRQPMTTWASIALMAVFYAVTTYVDMFVALMIVIFVMSIVWGERRLWLAGLVAVITPMTIFFLFDLVLKIRFPRGVLTNLYYG